MISLMPPAALTAQNSGHVNWGSECWSLLSMFRECFESSSSFLPSVHDCFLGESRPMNDPLFVLFVRKLLNTRAGESLGPLWREVEHAAKQGSNLPSLADVSAIWRSSYDDGPVEFARRLAEARPDSHSTGPTSSQGGLHPVKEYRDRAKRQRSQ